MTGDSARLGFSKIVQNYEKYSLTAGLGGIFTFFGSLLICIVSTLIGCFALFWLDDFQMITQYVLPIIVKLLLSSRRRLYTRRPLLFKALPLYSGT